MYTIMRLVSMRVRKYKNNPAKLQAVREWLWLFTLHTAYGLAKVAACSLFLTAFHMRVKANIGT